MNRKHAESGAQHKLAQVHKREKLLNKLLTEYRRRGDKKHEMRVKKQLIFLRHSHLQKVHNQQRMKNTKPQYPINVLNPSQKPVSILLASTEANGFPHTTVNTMKNITHLTDNNVSSLQNPSNLMANIQNKQIDANRFVNVATNVVQQQQEQQQQLYKTYGLHQPSSMPLSTAFRTRPVYFQVSTQLPLSSAVFEPGNKFSSTSIGTSYIEDNNTRQSSKSAITEKKLLSLMKKAREANKVATDIEEAMNHCLDPVTRIKLAKKLRTAIKDEKNAVKKVKWAVRKRRKQHIRHLHDQNHEENFVKGHSNMAVPVQAMSNGAVKALKQFRKLYDEGLISADEYVREKAGVFDRESVSRHVHMYRSGLLQPAHDTSLSTPSQQSGSHHHQEHDQYQRQQQQIQKQKQQPMQQYKNLSKALYPSGVDSSSSELSKQEPQPYRSPVHSNIMLRHRKEHFHALAQQINNMEVQFSDFTRTFREPKMDDDDYINEEAQGIQLHKNDDNVIKQASSEVTRQETQKFVAKMTSKIQYIKQGLAMVETVPWPEQVLLADPQFAKVRRFNFYRANMKTYLI